MIENFELEDWHIVAVIIGMFVTAIVSIFTHLLGRSKLAFEEKRFEHEQSLIREKAEYDAKSMLRAQQIAVANELFDIVGRMVTAESEEQFDRDWYDLSSIQYGRAYFLNDKKLHQKLGRFCDYLWEYNDYDLRFGFSEAVEEKFQADAFALSLELNKVIAEQFKLEVVDFELSPSKPKQKRKK